jgi:hypothetical protein
MNKRETQRRGFSSTVRILEVPGSTFHSPSSQPLGYYMRFVTALSIKMAVFWDAAPCILVNTDRRFRRAYRLYHQDDPRRPSSSYWDIRLILKYDRTFLFSTFLIRDSQTFSDSSRLIQLRGLL